MSKNKNELAWREIPCVEFNLIQAAFHATACLSSLSLLLCHLFCLSEPIYTHPLSLPPFTTDRALHHQLLLQWHLLSSSVSLLHSSSFFSSILFFFISSNPIAPSYLSLLEPWVGLTSVKPFTSTPRTLMSSLLPRREGPDSNANISLAFACKSMLIQYTDKNRLLLFCSRYGSIFKTHILGCPCVMISSPDAAKLVLVTKSHLFKPTFPASKERMLGKQAIFFNQGPYHAKLRKLVLRAFMLDSIKNIVPNIESIAEHSLHSLQGRLITTFQEMKTVSFPCGLCRILCFFFFPCFWFLR